MILIMLYDFIRSTQQKETSYQRLIFFYSYATYYDLFIARTEIKS
jgi:hypothetical protein